MRHWSQLTTTYADSPNDGARRTASGIPPAARAQSLAPRYAHEMLARLLVPLLLLTGGCSSATAASASGQSPDAGKTTAAGSADTDERQHLAETLAGARGEEAPTGVPPTWDWVAGATETKTQPPSERYTHANYWGAIFRGPRSSTPSNTVVSIRNCSMWLLLEGDTTWTKFAASVALDGSTFSPTYASGGPAPIILESVPTGVNVVPSEGNIWHFWQANGYQPLPNAVREIIVNCQARLDLREAGGNDDRSEADYLIHVGADFRNPADPSCAQDDFICPSWGVSRLERVTSAWRNHTFHSLSRADLDGVAPLPPRTLFDF